MQLTNVEVCPYCNSQNIITEYDWVRDIYIILCGNCRKKREVKGKEIKDMWEK